MMLRRLTQRAATVTGTAIAISHSNALDQFTPSNVYSTNARSFFRIRMVKSANQPGGEAGGHDNATTSSTSGSPTISGSVIQTEDDKGEKYAIEWDSKDFYKRLGLSKSCTDKEIRARYIDLAKKFHPDLSSGGNNPYLPEGAKPDDVFKNIKEAYEALSNAQTREFINARGSEEYQERQNQGYGVSPEEFARQQAMRQMFSDGLPFFMLSVALFLGVVAYHYKSRINTASLYYFVVILLVMSFFPRILAAALMYLMHCNDMIEVFEKEAQAAALVTVTAKQSITAPAAVVVNKKATPPYTAVPIPMDVTIRAEGIDAKHIPQGNMVVTVKKYVAPAAEGVVASEAGGEEVFVFAKGVTAVTLPLMLTTSASTSSGVDSPQWEMHVRFINDNLKLTLMEKKAYL